MALVFGIKQIAIVIFRQENEEKTVGVFKSNVI